MIRGLWVNYGVANSTTADCRWSSHGRVHCHWYTVYPEEEIVSEITDLQSQKADDN